MHLKHTELDRHTSGKHKSSLGHSHSGCPFEATLPFLHLLSLSPPRSVRAAILTAEFSRYNYMVTYGTANAQRSYILFLFELHTVI